MAFKRKTAPTSETDSKIKLIEVTVILEGTSHLLINARNDEVKDTLPGSKVTTTRAPSDERTDREEAESHLYKDKDGRLGLPEVSPWYALLEAGKWLPYNKVQKTVTKADGATVLPVLIPELLPQSMDEQGDGFFLFTDKDGSPKDPEWTVRREIQRLPRGGCMVNHIPTFKAGEWFLAVKFLYNPNFASQQLIKDLWTFAGMVAGFGQKRPGKGGRRGKFKPIAWVGFPEEKKKKKEKESSQAERNGDMSVGSEEDTPITSEPTNRLAEVNSQ